MTGSFLERSARFLAETGAAAEEHWQVIGVFGDLPEDCFTYTVGLTRVGLPELWIASLTGAAGGHLLNDVAGVLMDSPPAEVGHGLVVTPPLYQMPLRLRGPCDPDVAQALTARDLYGDRVSLLQVVWPDTERRYPDEDGYDAGHYPQRLLEVVSDG